MTIFKFLATLIDLINLLLNKYYTAKTEKKLEGIRNDSTTEWVDGVGVRKENDNDPTTTRSKQ